MKSIRSALPNGITKYASAAVMRLDPIFTAWIGPTRPTIPKPAVCGVPWIVKK